MTTQIRTIQWFTTTHGSDGDYLYSIRQRGPNQELDVERRSDGSHIFYTYSAALPLERIRADAEKLCATQQGEVTP